MCGHLIDFLFLIMYHIILGDEMKKIYKSVLVSIIITVLLSMLFVFPASAASIKYSVTGASGAKGDTVTVSVNLSSDTKIWGANVSLGFNSNELEYVSSAQGGLVSGGSLHRSGSKVNFSGMYNGKSGTVFTVKFKILKDSGTSALSLSSTENTDESGKVYSCSATGASVTVIKSVTGISLNSSSLTLKKGETSQLNATVTPSDATNRTVKYTSSNANVAKVDANGKITAVGGGTATITASAGGKNATCKVTVSVAQTGIKANGNVSRTVAVDSTVKLSVAKVPSDATDSFPVVWSSSNTSVATVSSNGTVKGVSLGETTITAKSNSWTATFNIKVVEKSEEPTTQPSSENATESTTQEATTDGVKVPVTVVVTDPNTGETLTNPETGEVITETVYENTTSDVTSEPNSEAESAGETDTRKETTVSKTYHYIMMTLSCIVMAVISVSVTYLVTSGYYKKKYNNDSIDMR